MNKLRKPRPSDPPAAMSHTMQLAVSGVRVSATTPQRDIWTTAAAPHTAVEQYWATRALVAETLLSARDRHQADLAAVRRMEGEKHKAEMRAILDANDQKQTIMLLCLAVLLGFVAWLVMMITNANGKSSHFTIPILSPFASVVEHETGVFGTKAVVVSVVVIGIGVYGAVRHGLCR